MGAQGKLGSMSPSTTAAATPTVRNEAARRRELRAMQRRATALLAVVSVAFVVAVITTGDHGWHGFLRAGLEAAMVGGIADWFAVTAVFRHPLGLPIPHTAVVAARKDQFGETLGAFVQEHFLNPEVLTERVANARVADRLSRWLVTAGNAERLAGHGAEAIVRLADALHDDDVHRYLDSELRRRIDAIPAAPMAGRVLASLTAEGRHRPVVDAALRALDDFLTEQEPALRARFGENSPWWLPGAVEDRIFDRLLAGVRAILHDEPFVAVPPASPTGPDGTGVTVLAPAVELRERIDAWLAHLIERLQHDPELLRRGEELKHGLLEQPEVRQWTASIWGEVKASLRAQANDPGSELRQRLADAARSIGERLTVDRALAVKVDEAAVRAAASLADQVSTEVPALIAGTVARWDAAATSDRLELLLGRDLQFIRINGTVVGGLAGLALHAVAVLLG